MFQASRCLHFLEHPSAFNVAGVGNLSVATFGQVSLFFFV